MSETFINYPIREIAISTENSAPLNSGHERKLEGDIVAVRNVSNGIGSGETKKFIWLRVEGLEKLEMDVLIEPLTEEPFETIYDKRRYCIPLERLQKFVPTFDINRAKDATDIYQPFLNIDEDNFLYLEGTESKTLRIEGLVFDKVTGGYL